MAGPGKQGACLEYVEGIAARPVRGVNWDMGMREGVDAETGIEVIGDTGGKTVGRTTGRIAGEKG